MNTVKAVISSDLVWSSRCDVSVYFRRYITATFFFFAKSARVESKFSRIVIGVKGAAVQLEPHLNRSRDETAIIITEGEVAAKGGGDNLYSFSSNSLIRDKLSLF